MLIKILMGFSVYILFICFLIIIFVKMLNFLCKNFIGDELNMVCRRLIDGKSLKNEEKIDTTKPLKTKIKSKFYCRKNYMIIDNHDIKYQMLSEDIFNVIEHFAEQNVTIKEIYIIGYKEGEFYEQFPEPVLMLRNEIQENVIEKYYIEPYKKVFGINKESSSTCYHAKMFKKELSFGAMLHYFEENEPYIGDKER